jgi:maltose O-acetyltransferase
MSVGARCRFERIRYRYPEMIDIGPRNALSNGCWLWPSFPEEGVTRIKIGERNYFNRDVMLDACGLIEIGSNNMFGPGVYITDSDHVLNPGHPLADSPMIVGTVRIGDNCWLGARAMVLKNVELGSDCIVAAGAVVTKSFPAGSIIGGVPARIIRDRVPKQNEG